MSFVCVLQASTQAITALPSSAQLAIHAFQIERLIEAIHTALANAFLVEGVRGRDALEALLTDLVNQLVDFDALRPMKVFWRRAICLNLLWTITIGSAAGALEAVVSSNREWWEANFLVLRNDSAGYLAMCIVGLLMVIAQIATTALLLKRQTQKITELLLRSVEETLSTALDREDLKALLKSILEVTQRAAFDHLGFFGRPLEYAFSRWGGTEKAMLIVSAKQRDEIQPMIRSIFEKIRENDDAPNPPTDQRPNNIHQPTTTSATGARDPADVRSDAQIDVVVMSGPRGGGGSCMTNVGGTGAGGGAGGGVGGRGAGEGAGGRGGTRLSLQPVAGAAVGAAVDSFESLEHLMITTRQVLTAAARSQERAVSVIETAWKSHRRKSSQKQRE